jgi:NAD(P)-dependent dehydrogenase (short-subunit alcohol dehydrogenase family)
MTVVGSLPEKARVVVVGASGAIGRAFVERLTAEQRVGAVYAASRSPVAFDDSRIVPLVIDIEDESSIAAAAEACAVEGALDMVIVATGILHQGDSIQPEKRMQDIDANSMATVFAINCIGPTMIAKHFLPKLRKHGKTVFAALSARVGSISDNRLGGWTSYRVSKAALNMALRTLSIEHARSRPESVVVGLHPGTVDSRLSAPFQRRVPVQQLFSPAHAADCLLGVIDGLDSQHSGRLFAWDGREIDF